MALISQTGIQLESIGKVREKMLEELEMQKDEKTEVCLRLQQTLNALFDTAAEKAKVPGGKGRLPRKALESL